MFIRNLLQLMSLKGRVGCTVHRLRRLNMIFKSQPAWSPSSTLDAFAWDKYLVSTSNWVHEKIRCKLETTANFPRGLGKSTETAIQLVGSEIIFKKHTSETSKRYMLKSRVDGSEFTQMQWGTLANTNQKAVKTETPVKYSLRML
jgi:homogentisate 1,2-dioxygenase